MNITRVRLSVSTMPRIRSISFCWILWNLFKAASHRLPHYPRPPSEEAGGWRRRLAIKNSLNDEALWIKIFGLTHFLPLWRSNGGGFCNNFSRSSSTSRVIWRNWRRLAWGVCLGVEVLLELHNLPWKLVWGVELKPLLLSCQLGAERF